MKFALISFLLYFCSGVVLLAVFTRIYVWFTPYSEFVEIRAGKKAPAIALGGAMIGYTIPIVAASHAGVDFSEFMLWAVISGIVQLVCFKVLYGLLPRQIEADNQAVATFFAAASVSIGLINAFSLIP